MSLTIRLSLSFMLLSLVVLTGCGSMTSGGAGPINGSFNNSSLSGSYTISFTGANQNGFLAVAGSFQANGSGTITGGTVDINSGGGIFQNQSITGTYNVHANGQATATLIASAGTFDIDFVLLSSSSGLVMRFDANSSASGTIALQTSSAFSLAALAGSFAFNVSGANAAGNGNPEASGGVFTVDSSGNLTSGVQDTNDFGTISSNVAMTPANGAMTSPTNGRGTLAIGGRNFVYYVVNANHMKLIEVDLAPALAGDAFRQSGTAISGSFAFTIAGNTGALFAAGGIINTDGAGNVLNTSTEDVNNGGSVTENIALSGTYSVAANGRGTLALNGNTFAIYPSTAGIQVIEIDTFAVASGAAFQQTGPFSNSSVQGNYGWDFTGEIGGANEIDSIAQFAATGAGSATGAVDFNNGGGLSNNLALTGTYTIAASGRGTATFQSQIGTQNIVFYVVNGTRVLFIDVDGGLVAVGELDHQ
ncbi:MAG TPA: hypothetical protein VKY85_09820 [Candidatus Angelobacter sp.]|nr:hypothetical protein [Candidatus Angelobacter sp.]